MRYKITPETTEKEVNTRRCFQLPGSKEDVVKTQSVFPNIDGFKVREPKPGSDPLLRASSGSGGVLGSWRCSPLSQGVQGAGTGQHMPPHPGAQGGSLLHLDLGWTAGSFPNPGSRVGTCRSPHKRRCFGTAWASCCTAAQLPGRSRRGAAHKWGGQQAVTELDTEPDTCPWGNMETCGNMKTWRLLEQGCSQAPPLWVHIEHCAQWGVPRALLSWTGGVCPVLHPKSSPHIPPHAWLCANEVAGSSPSAQHRLGARCCTCTGSNGLLQRRWVGRSKHRGGMWGPHPEPPHPDAVSPQFLREEYYRGRYCAVWQNVTRWAQKKNVYTLWVTNSSCGVAPVHYEMRGYNSLLGSHYDKYEITYTDFDNSFPASIFDLPINGELGWAPRHPAGGARADGFPSLLPRDEEVWGPAREHGGAPGAGEPHGGPGGTTPALGP